MKKGFIEKNVIEVVVTGADHPTGLGTARAIAGMGVKILGIYKDSSSPCCKSNVWSSLYKCSSNDEDLLRKLFQLGEKSNQKFVLIPAQDRVVKILSDNRNILQNYFYFVLPTRQTINMLLDKTHFYEWAHKHDFPIPKSFIVTDRNELDKVLDTITYPVVIKPFEKTSLWDSVSPVDKILKFKQKEDIKSINFDLFQASPKILVQEWIPGGDSNIHFCLVYYNREGEELAYYTGRKLLQWPSGCGSTTVAVGTLNEKIHQITKEVFMKAGFCGLGSMEFKQSKEDRKYYIMEPTVCRNDLQSFIAVSGGMNLTKIALYDAIYRKNIFNGFGIKKGVWIDENNLFDSIIHNARTSKFKFKEFSEILNGKISFAYLKISDPIPFMQIVKKKILNRINLKFF